MHVSSLSRPTYEASLARVGGLLGSEQCVRALPPDLKLRPSVPLHRFQFRDQKSWDPQAFLVIIQNYWESCFNYAGQELKWVWLLGLKQDVFCQV